MAKETDNRIWRAHKTGRPPAFASPEDMWSRCVEYFDWAHDNPLTERKAFQFQGAVITEDLPKMRAMSIVGMCNYLGITRQTWANYRDNPEFADTLARVEQVIWQQKFEGAAADLLNASIIVRELGLAEKTELTGKDGGPVETADVTAVLRAKLDAIADRKAGGASEG